MKTKLLTCLTAAGLALSVLAFSGSIVPAGADDVQSLRGTAPVTSEDAAPPVYNVQEGQRFDKNYRQQPPLIPHRIDKYEIDLKVNQCLRCHDWPNNVKENAPMVSVSHMIDRDGNKLDRVSNQRWFCVQCHVPQAEAKPLVENKFQPATSAK